MVSASKDIVKIRGIITPAKWDERGNVIGLAIATFDEDEFFIERNKQGEGLYSLMRKEVEVSGLIKEMDGKKHIEIKDYSTKKGQRDLK
ncbi:MAG: hypothetical protein JW932_05475 [Deltaproteobacteria bacterium]|nr:hypothetical protein [Deltaproteobacteria bacterium]